jgi:hypothetical protein
LNNNSKWNQNQIPHCQNNSSKLVWSHHQN